MVRRCGALITDRLLEWPPDVFALTNVVLARAEAFRYALSAKEWPPQRFDDWAQAVIEAARHCSAWAEDRTGALPDLVASEWRVQCQGAEVPLKQVEPGRDDQVCEALLTLHAIADEACAGRGVALDSCGADGCQYRAHGREMLARTGSLARIDPPAPAGLAQGHHSADRGPVLSWRVVIRPLAHRGPRGSPRRNNPRRSGSARLALDARGTKDQATNRSLHAAATTGSKNYLRP